MMNLPKSDPGPTRRSGELFLEELDKRLSLGKDEERYLIRRLYLV